MRCNIQNRRLASDMIISWFKWASIVLNCDTHGHHTKFTISNNSQSETVYHWFVYHYNLFNCVYHLIILVSKWINLNYEWMQYLWKIIIKQFNLLHNTWDIPSWKLSVKECSTLCNRLVKSHYEATQHIIKSSSSSLILI